VDPDEDAITTKLRALRADSDRQAAMSKPRVVRGKGGARYFIDTCPHCGDGAYHHLDPCEDTPTPALRLELAYCEACGVVERWRVLPGLPDGSTRALGPDFGADPPPVPGG